MDISFSIHENITFYTPIFIEGCTKDYISRFVISENKIVITIVEGRSINGEIVHSALGSGRGEGAMSVAGVRGGTEIDFRGETFIFVEDK